VSTLFLCAPQVGVCANQNPAFVVVMLINPMRSKDYELSLTYLSKEIFSQAKAKLKISFKFAPNQRCAFAMAYYITGYELAITESTIFKAL